MCGDRTPVTVGVAGELDLASAPELGRRFALLVGSTDGRALVLDLTDVSFIDAAGLRAVVGCNGLCRRRGVRLECQIPAEGPVRRIFELVGELAAAGRATMGRC